MCEEKHVEFEYIVPKKFKNTLKTILLWRNISLSVLIKEDVDSMLQLYKDEIETALGIE